MLTVLHYLADGLWILAMALIASTSRGALKRVPATVKMPMWGGVRLPRLRPVSSGLRRSLSPLGARRARDLRRSHRRLALVPGRRNAVPALRAEAAPVTRSGFRGQASGFRVGSGLLKADSGWPRCGGLQVAKSPNRQITKFRERL